MNDNQLDQKVQENEPHSEENTTVREPSQHPVKADWTKSEFFKTWLQLARKPRPEWKH